ncbi:ShlB/FhaC/HecB family hemolysin secretion/activation protein [Roseateles oligotrophus]|uniref:ShlB/FhaC/HecB family hemolysin secretion/activation protein n=1 Tax=Roseateles oligotrophus TaxID=1769250 RepID=A0ABT2YAH3_9BURK|nr:ShlB/FhaC/HecB family hemolysin secretion/activation protein [Roseateles oligotrophus]MCV2367302.1 ShlB/FhaC/HecB family hemolysin secretion/activation protein [Roseateles oligotrophus]
MELFHKIRAPFRARLYFRAGVLSCSLLPLAGLGLLAPVQAQQATEGASAAIAVPKFDILEFEIDGNTRLSDLQIEAAVLPFLGPQLGMTEVEAARAALEKAYQSAGYLTVFVDVPEQRVDGGVIRLTVLEGRVGALYVTGSQYYAQGRIRSAVTELAPGQVPNFNTVQQQIASVSRGDERRVQPVLKPGRAPGTVEAELKVEDKLPLGGSIDFSNAAALGTDPFRMAANLHYDNFLQRDHVISLSLMGAPASPKESRVVVFNYTAPLADGDTLNFTAIDSSSDLESLGGTRVLGRGTTLGFRYGMSKPLPDSVHSLSVGFDYKNLTEDVRTSGGVIASPLQYMPFQAGYNGAWWGDTLQQQLSVTAVLGLRPLLQNTRGDCQLLDGSFGPADQFACKRRGADGGFATLRGDWRVTQRLGPAELGLRLSGQLANQSLTSAEQFSVGGADTVRGYDEGAATGDRGLLASLELRSRNLAPGLLAAFEGATLPAFSEIVFYGFADAARVNLYNPEPGQQARTPLLGTGLGFRLAVQQGLSLALDWGQRRKPVPSNPAASSEHVHVRAGLRF